MKRSLPVVLLSAFLALLPPGIAHDDQGGPGTPDFTCQTPEEWQVHDYAGANGQTVADISDNNLEECGTTYGLFIAGTPECRELEDRLGAQDPADPFHPLWLLLCRTDRPADYDGDLEFALGGALLAVESGDGETAGSIVCLGTLGHHSNTISVLDEVFGSNVIFTVGADASLVPVPGEPDCGDGVTRPCEPSNSGLGPTVDAVLGLLQTGNCNPADHRVLCYSVCDVPFGPGAEGTYVVWVHPTLDAGPGGTPTGASHGHVSSIVRDPPQLLGGPGPLVLSVYWGLQGGSTNVAYTYDGSYTCDLTDPHFQHFRVECEALDIANFHCVNPGVEAYSQGVWYSATRARLECGQLSGECYTGAGLGTCVQPIPGTDFSTTLVCSGGMDYITPTGSGTNYPPLYQVTCYSDPPALPVE